MKKYLTGLFYSSVAMTSSLYANKNSNKTIGSDLFGGEGGANDNTAAKSVFADLVTYISWGGIVMGLVGILGSGYAYTQGKTEAGKLGLIGSLIIFSAGAIAKALT